MSSWPITLGGLGVVVLVYTGFVLWLAAAGRRAEARAVARFLPDCVVLLRRLMSEPQVDRWRKVLLGTLVAYLVLPVDVVPDFIPLAGHLDDAVIVALALRLVLRSGGEPLLRRHWPGPDSSLAILLRFAAGTGSSAGRGNVTGPGRPRH